ncbi:MAG: prepilin-type N-terminal cleavage/methylation domain-containing protein [Oscillospiraceae bacterium]|nr:prepilin-type N-terminal cleavage/methylation domain-containing protein [Oscillospiraceae bacterium]
MKFTKTWKRFWTLNRHHAGGFTLVELIVVIAILAILAGIAIPAYSGYINKAKEAGDYTLLSAVNTAFAAACLDDGVASTSYADGSVTFDVDAMLPSKHQEKFAIYFAGNTQKFDVFTGLTFKGGMFITDDMVTLTYKDANGNEYNISVSQSQADALKNNNLSDLGADVLLGKVGNISDIAAGLLDPNNAANPNSVFEQLIYGDDEGATYLANLAASLGMEMDEEFYKLVYTADENDNPVLNSSVLANSLVLSAAQQSQGMDTSFLGQEGSAASLRNELNDPDTAQDAMAKLALTYGMYTAYVNSEAGKNAGATDQSSDIIASGNFSGMTNVLATLESEEFRNYLGSSEGQADLNAYMSSMEIISNSSSSGAAQDILTNGFNSSELNTLLGDLMKSE